jgi:hypothetical protein
MNFLRLAGLGAAALLMSHPTIALADDCGDSPCMCVDDCGVQPPPPPPNLPPPVAIFGSGQANQRYDSYHDGVHQAQVGPYAYDYVVQPGRIGDAPLSGGSNTGAFSANVTLYPDASVDVGSINGIVGANLLYSVVLHAPNPTAAAYITSLLGISGAIAQVHGVSFLSAYANDLGGYADDYVTTGAGLFGDQEAYVPLGLYGNVSGNIGLFARQSFDCDMRNYDSDGHYGTAGCGMKDFTLPVNFVSATNFVGGSALDFIGNVELSAGSTSIQSGPVDSYLDPVVSFSPGFNNQGIGLTVGGGMVANGAVPEPAAWGLMLLGFTALGAALRRRRSAALA